MTMFELLEYNHKTSGCKDWALTDQDLAHLADWANDCKSMDINPDWKKAFALIREGADLLLRRRAMSRVTPANMITFGDGNTMVINSTK